MVAITALKAGDEVFDVVSQQAGNTTARRKAVFKVKIIEVDPEGGYVIARWNNNPERKFRATSVKKWRRSAPDMI